LNNQKALIDWRTDQFGLGIVLSLGRFGMHPYQYEEEPKGSPLTVERVAQRGKHSARFLREATSTGLNCIIRMTAGWPVERYRTPAELIASWQEQHEGR
jgi:hypothetical protein